MKSQKKEIIWNIINSLLAGALVFLGALTTGEITAQSIGAAMIASLIVACTQFKRYWETEEKEYQHKKTFGSFIGV